MDALGVELGARWTAIEAVGLYVPGGTAAYPSSVLMNAVPAKVAGVPRIVMVVPAPGGVLSPLVLAAAKLAGVDEIYRIGGAQAIAALAYGTATIAPVAKIVGPGNAYVAAAKRLVFGKVGIDMIAGPSEVLILADATGNADWIAADLLAQAEHDVSAQAILITDDAELAARSRAFDREPTRPLAPQGHRRRLMARFRRSHPDASLEESPQLVDAIAPEHLEIAATDAERLPAASATPARSSSGAYARSDRRLCGRLQPCVADRAVGAFLVRARRSGFHEAHVDPEMRAGAIARAGRRGDYARPSRRSRGSCPLGRHQAQSLMARTEPTERDIGRLVAVTLDELSIGRSSPDVEHERAVAIYDLIDANAFVRLATTVGLTRSTCASTATAWFSISGSPTARR